MAATQAEANAIFGTDKKTLKIADLKSVEELVKQIIDSTELAKKIIHINIDEAEPPEEEEESVADDSNPSDEVAPEISRKDAREAENKRKDAEASRLTIPIIQVLNAICEHSGHLTHFTWRVPYSSSIRFTRPEAFWIALYAHAQTLRILQLDFFEHEVHDVTVPTVSFPLLEVLELETSGAHGDDGKAIDALLKQCPNMRTLKFSWPGCDLSTCQIQNISWNYTFRFLTKLSLNGWDFAPENLVAFLTRHPGVEVFSDAIDGPYEEDIAAEQFDSLPASILPNIKALYKSYHDFRSLTAYFATDANRPIKHLVLRASFHSTKQLENLSLSERAKSSLIVLELMTDITTWRPKEDSSDDEDNSDEENDAESNNKENKVAETTSSILSEAQIAERYLPEFTGLQELGLSLESGNAYFRQPGGEYGLAPPAKADDVRLILGLLPSTINIHILRLGDSRADALPQSLLNDLPQIPSQLEYLIWEAQEKTVYRIERGQEKTRAVECPSYEEVGFKLENGAIFKRSELRLDA